MTGPMASHDLGPEALKQLAVILRAAGEDVKRPLVSTLLVGGRSNLTYRVTDGQHSWVLRRPPMGGLTSSAHDVLREFRVGSALQQTEVPVARTVVADSSDELLGAPFTVVSFVPGTTVRSRADMSGWSDPEVAACTTGLVETLVALHQVDFHSVGLGDFGRTSGYAARQLRRWSGQWLEMDARHPLAEKLFDILHRNVPEQATCSLVHGDYRVDNVLLDSDDVGRVLAVVDWELSTLGDPVADVALMCAYRHPALDAVLGLEAAWASHRFPSPERLRAEYEEQAARRLDNWNFHMALAYYKLASITQGIAHRHRLGATAGEGYERAADAIPQFLEAGLDAVHTLTSGSP